MIKVGIYGVVRLKTGIGHFESDAKTLRELKGKIPGLARKEADDLVVLVNGKSVGRNYRFKENDEVVFLSPAGGG